MFTRRRSETEAFLMRMLYKDILASHSSFFEIV